MKNMRKASRAWVNPIGVVLLVLLALPFAAYAVAKALLFADVAEQGSSRFFAVDAPFASYALYLHMATGGIITVSAPLQLLSWVRSNTPALHRAVGRLTVLLAFVTGCAGTFYILRAGTIGGWWMDAGFGFYGILMILSAYKTWLCARRRDPMHSVWAVRLIILALASWLYRVHYGLWELATGGLGTTDEFSGPFDQVQVFGFYLPYLVVFEVVRRRKNHRL